jgi:hypothetical protein
MLDFLLALTGVLQPFYGFSLLPNTSNFEDVAQTPGIETTFKFKNCKNEEHEALEFWSRYWLKSRTLTARRIQATCKLQRTGDRSINNLWSEISFEIPRAQREY